MNIVIVGAGPAGIRAAEAFVRNGVRPIVIDEAPAWGGQIYRQQPAGFRRTPKQLYGFESKRAQSVHGAMAAILPQVDYRPSTLVWNAEAGRRHLDVIQDGRNERLPFDRVLVATGATDRVLPFPGWTLPGVYTLGAAQIALKYQGCGVGSRVVFSGSGPLLYLVAYQYAKAGAQVVAVLDRSTTRDKLAGLARMSKLPTVLTKGLYYTAWLRVHGVPIFEGAHVLRASGAEGVEKLVWHDGREERELACDAIATGFALRSETQLADLLGCEFGFDPLQRSWLPVRDAQGRSSVQGIYLAGDGAGIQGADAAEAAGELAALTMLQDAGSPDPDLQAPRVAQLRKRLERVRAFRQGLERAFPFPEDWAARVPDEVLICRCEEISVGELRQSAARCDARELNRLKALTRVGMGRCQGRMCGAAAAEVLAHATGRSVQDVGRLRAQAPVKPIPFAMVNPCHARNRT